MVEIKDNLELQMLLNNKESGFTYRERRHPDWRENYELYRDKVLVNRLTQRQSVNLPIMKTTLRTVLKDVDEMPVILFEETSNDKQSQIFLNEYWKWTLKTNNAEIQDVVDKKQDFFFGRTFDSWQIEDGKIVFDIEDTEDILVSRFMNPYDINSSEFLIHMHIFRPLSSLVNNPEYDQNEVRKLVDFFESTLGIIKAKDNQNALQEKNKKLEELGVTDMEDPVLGETYVELTMHYVFRSNEKDSKGKVLDRQIFVYTEAEDQVILQKRPQEEMIGVTKDHWWRDHYRYHTWGDDIDKQDFWTDGIADSVRTPNKVVNSWFSQLVENRTLRNFGMHYYDSSLKADGFTPSTFNPMPWGWYPVPGKPSDVLQKVDIPDLSESLDEIEYVIQMAEKASGAVATKQGVQTQKEATLGEIRALQFEATERTKGMSKFYTRVWEQRGQTFLKLIEAAPDKLETVKIYREGKNTDDIFSRDISPEDYMTKAGYRVRVWDQNEKKAADNDRLIKLQAVYASMPNNPKLKEIYHKKLLDYAELTPDEITVVIEAEKQMPELPSPPQSGIMGQEQQLNPQIQA